MSHPDLDTLVRFSNGTLPLAEKKAIQQHLRACRACREAERGVQATTEALRGGAPAPVEDRETAPGMLAAILDGIHQWEAARSGAEPWDDVKGRVSGKIGLFLGGRAAGKLLASVNEDGGNLLSTIEPVLADFLGERAASELVEHVVDRAIVEI